jgi:hypothetical protein
LFYKSISILALIFLFSETILADEIKELQMLHLKTGVHQGSPYNSRLEPVEHIGSKTPLVGCVPLSIARILAYYTERNDISDYQNFIEDIHINSRSYIEYKADATYVTNNNVGKVTYNEGYSVNDLDFLFFKSGSSGTWRERVSKTYIWIKDKIDRNIPVIAVSRKGGHAFVIDGYKKVDPSGYPKEDLYFHVLLGLRYSDGSVNDNEWVQADQYFFKSHTNSEFFNDFWEDDVYFYTINHRSSINRSFSLKASELNNNGFYAINTKHKWGSGDIQNFKRYQHSEQAAVMKKDYSSYSYIVKGDIWRKYVGSDGMSHGAGGATGKLGYPISEEYNSRFWGYDVRRQDFVGGSIVWIRNGKFFGWTRAQDYNGHLIAQWSKRE